MVTIEFDDQQLQVLAEIMGTVAMPMKITLPLMQHIEKQVNEQRQVQAKAEADPLPEKPRGKINAVM